MSRSKGNCYNHCCIPLIPYKIILIFGKIASSTSLFKQFLAINRATPPNRYLSSISNNTYAFKISYRYNYIQYNGKYGKAHAILKHWHDFKFSYCADMVSMVTM